MQGLVSIACTSPPYFVTYYLGPSHAPPVPCGTGVRDVRAWTSKRAFTRDPVHEGKGLTQTVHEFGQLMQATSGGVSRVPDVTLARLGYSTDNGAMYCYCKQHCDTTLLQVKRAWDEAGIPMAYMTFEGSWFENNWSAMWWCVQRSA